MQKRTAIPDPLPANATPAQATVWVRRLVRFIGPGFHPDTSFADYVQPDGEPSFTPAQSGTLETNLRAAWAILDRAGIDIYAVALPVQRRLLMNR